MTDIDKHMHSKSLERNIGQKYSKSESLNKTTGNPSLVSSINKIFQFENRIDSFMTHRSKMREYENESKDRLRQVLFPTI